VHSVNAEGMNGKLFIGREFIIKGADFDSDSKLIGVVLHANTGIHSAVVSFDPPILSMTDSEIRCAWPEDFQKPVGDGCGELVIGRIGNSKDPEKYVRRSIKVSIVEDF